jgi:hypothetical protein
MTNEQFAVFLRTLAGRVRALAAEIEPTITDGQYETKRVWAGEGPLPTLGIETILNWKSSPAADPANWREERGRPVACARIEALADELIEQAEMLAAAAPEAGTLRDALLSGTPASRPKPETSRTEIRGG